MSRSKGRLTLPDIPSLEQLREQAKERLDIIRTHVPDAQLSDAQFALARDYGFSSWRALKAEVDRRSGAANGLVGHYADASGLLKVLSVTAKGQRLFVDFGKGVTIEIIPQFMPMTRAFLLLGQKMVRLFFQMMMKASLVTTKVE